MSHVVFLTGATGNVGAELLNTLLHRPDVRQVAVLVRAGDELAGLARIREALWNTTGAPVTSPTGSKIRIVCGDLTMPALGIEPREYEDLASSITCIVHAAASTQFTLPLESAREINCNGTRRVLELARAADRSGCLRRIIHVSTAYVCGSRSGIVREDDRMHPIVFANAYEQSKWEAEEITRKEFGDLPITIVRPSIIVGHSQTGRILCCNVLYTPLRWILQGRLARLSCPPDTPVDVVSIDFVADAIAYLGLDAENIDDLTIHLTAGMAHSMTVGQIIEYAIHYVGQRNSNGKFTDCPCPQVAWTKEDVRPSQTRSPLDAFHPYMSIRRDLDTSRRQSILDVAGITPKHLSQYLPNILEYCLRTNWGRKPSLLEQGEWGYRSCVA